RTGDPSSSLSALLAESKKRPRAISVAIPSTSSRVVLAEINRLGGTQLVPVGYNGSANAVTDLLGGHVDATIDTLGALKTYIQAGKITPLAVSLSERSAAMPNLPTIVEAGLNGFSVSPWNVIAAPAGTPAPIVELLSRRLREVFAEPEVRESLQNRNGLVFGKEEAMSVDEIRRFIADELAKWGQLIRTSGIQPQ
ncbi:MAG: tripartite tricarboxylate transporter substrate binding protein, partial [Burkholderiaceae bacterium]